jgi:hypothetical protein
MRAHELIPDHLTNISLANTEVCLYSIYDYYNKSLWGLEKWREKLKEISKVKK